MFCYSSTISDEHLTVEEQALAVAELENEMKTALLPPPVPTGFVAGGTIGVSVVPGHSSSSNSGNRSGIGGSVDVSMNIDSSRGSGSGSSSSGNNAAFQASLQSLRDLYPHVFTEKNAQVMAGGQRMQAQNRMPLLQQQQEQQQLANTNANNSSNSNSGGVGAGSVDSNGATEGEPTCTIA